MIDILLSTYNGQLYLAQQLDSILSQTCTDYTLWIRDDGSSDSTVAIVEDYCRNHPGKIRRYKDKKGNIGASASFNELIGISSADYVMLCDQDDVWFNDKIEITLRAMKELEREHFNAPLLVFTDMEVVDSNLNTINDSFIRSQKLDPEALHNPWKSIALSVAAGCVMMFNAKAKSIVYQIPTGLGLCHDQWIACNLSRFGFCSYVDRPTSHYRLHSHNVVGIKKISLGYWASKIPNLFGYIKIYWRLIQRLKFHVNVPAVIYYKLYYIITRSKRIL
jgi:glycosyltransferase involved in cell wall biosynthesis